MADALLSFECITSWILRNEVLCVRVCVCVCVR